MQGLTASNLGRPDINGGSVTTTGGGQNYGNAVVLTAHTMLTDTAGGTIRFAGSVDGAKRSRCKPTARPNSTAP